MSNLNIAMRYATALYETAAEKDALKSILEDMAFIESLINSAGEIKRFCLKPHTKGVKDMLFIETAFVPYVSELTGNTIKVAVHNGRLTILPLLPKAFEKICDKNSGSARAFLETAHEPADGLLEIVAERMQKRTGKPINLEHTLKPELLGGFRIWCEGRLIDNSAAGRLVRLRRLLADKLA